MNSGCLRLLGLVLSAALAIIVSGLLFAAL
jgi:hypothetical protein